MMLNVDVLYMIFKIFHICLRGRGFRNMLRDILDDSLTNLRTGQ